MSFERPIKILIVTATYPYGSGEGFLTGEFKALTKYVGNIIIAPLRKSGKIRPATSLPSASSKISYKLSGLFGLSVVVFFARAIIFRPLDVLKFTLKIINNKSFYIAMKNLAILPKAFWLSNVCIKNEVTHIHAHWASTTSTCAMIASEISGVPWSFTCHRWDIYENNMLSIKSISSEFTRFISNRGACDGVRLGVSGDKSYVIHMGVEVPADMPLIRRKSDSINIVCAANLIPVKGHKYLLEAASMLKKNNIKFSMTIIGEGSLEKNLRDQVAESDLINDVLFLGQLSHYDLMKMYDESYFDLFVLPSIELAEGVHEGIPVSLMEAMAKGIPVISTKTGSIPELLSDGLGCTVADKDAFALYEIISSVANSPSRWEYLKERQWEVIKMWSSENSASQLVNKIYVVD